MVYRVVERVALYQDLRWLGLKSSMTSSLEQPMANSFLLSTISTKIVPVKIPRNTAPSEIQKSR